ncbi:MAG: response regulator [Proteobacteria bacterium]|nr:response regulator [Pseudomonadota bacterium]
MRILVVDDESQIRTLCERGLKKAGYEVRLCSDGEEALAALSEDWDIVLSDLSMPGKVSGTELLRRAKALGTADVILMTGSPEIDTVIEALHGGAYDYLIKPFHIEVLERTVKRCLETRRLSKELAREKALRAELSQAYAKLSQMEKVRSVFGQFVTPEVVEFALAHEKDYRSSGQRRTLSVFFADIRGFTPFAHRHPPEKVVEALNDIFERVVAAIQAEGGMLNKFVGDGMLALFGAPLPKEDHALLAARAALEAVCGVEALAGVRRAQGLESLHIGVGIATGEVVAGCVGTGERMEYTVIGHAVNLAARLEGLAGPGEVLAGPETVALLPPEFVGRSRATSIAGISESVVVSTLKRPA